MRKAVDLLNKSDSGRIEFPRPPYPEHPALHVVNKISPTQGHELQLQTRANLKMALAGQFAVVYTEYFHSDFVRELMDTTMRFGVSMFGDGRKEDIECLRASGSTPDAYFTQGIITNQGKKSFVFTRSEENDDS